MTTALAAGRLRLRAELAGQRTVLSDVFRTAPFHPGPVHHRGGTAEVVLQGVGPGLFPGERLEIDINVKEGASLVVSAQGATKVYASPHGTAAEAATTLRVGRGASLCWLPGELIPFRDASYAARTEVHLEEGARFALLDILTPGRTAMGEVHAYRQLDLRLRVASRGKPILVERALLDPKREPLTLIGSQGDVPCIGTLILAGYELPARIGHRDDDLWLAGDGDGVIGLVRALGRSAAGLRAALLAVLADVAMASDERTPA